MNHNTARCSACNTIVTLPHLRARASAAKCEACARREAEMVREQCARSIFDVVPPLPPPPKTDWLDLKLPSGAPVRVWPGPGITLSVPRDAVVYDDKREQRGDEYATSPSQMTPKPYLGPSDLFGNHGAYGNPRECFQRISHAIYRRNDDMVEVSFMGELGHAKNTLSVSGAFVRTCFGEGYDVGKLVGGEVRYEGVTGKITGLSAGPDKWEQRARELTEEKRREKRVTCRPVMDPGDLCGGCDDCMDETARHWGSSSGIDDAIRYAFEYVPSTT